MTPIEANQLRVKQVNAAASYWEQQGDMGSVFMLFIMQHDGWEKVAAHINKYCPPTKAEFKSAAIALFSNHWKD